MKHDPVLSQDNNPSSPRISKPARRVFFRIYATPIIAAGILLSSTAHLQWHLPNASSMGSTPQVMAAKPDVNLMLAPAKTSSVSAKTIHKQFSAKQPLEDVVIRNLEQNTKMPTDSNGLPIFYATIFNSGTHGIVHGLAHRRVNKNFGYDQQDIFTGKIATGAYVLHCQKAEQANTRTMCWREMQTSTRKWVQYRFPRAILKDWKKIEAEVRAVIG